MDSQGYLTPVQQQNSKPKYLELLSDSAEPGPSYPSQAGPVSPSSVPVHTQRAPQGCVPMLSSKIPRVSPARSLNYSQLASDGEEEEEGALHLLPEDVASNRKNNKPRRATNGNVERHKIDYAELATAEDDHSRQSQTSPPSPNVGVNQNGKVPPPTRPNGDTLHYAQLSPSVSDPDMEIDSSSAREDSPTGSQDGYLDDDHPRSRSGARSGTDKDKPRTGSGSSDPFLVLPDNTANDTNESVLPSEDEQLFTGQGQGQADVRSKITGDTDLSKMGLHIWEPGDLVPEHNPNNNNLFLPPRKRGSSPFLRDVSPFSDKSSLRSSPFRFDGLDDKSGGGPFIYDGFLAPHDMDRRGKLDRASPINGLPISRLTSSSDSSF